MDVNHKGFGANFLMELWFIGALALLLLAAAISDLRFRTISNGLNISIAAAAFPLWWLMGYELWPDVALQLAAAIGVFLLFVGLFALGAMGGGDVKMIGALCLWTPLALILPALTIMAIAGGLLSAAMLVRAKWTRESSKVQVPYGVAIAAAGFWVLYKHYLNHFSFNAFA